MHDLTDPPDVAQLQSFIDYQRTIVPEDQRLPNSRAPGYKVRPRSQPSIYKKHYVCTQGELYHAHLFKNLRMHPVAMVDDVRKCFGKLP